MACRLRQALVNFVVMKILSKNQCELASGNIANIIYSHAVFPVFDGNQPLLMSCNILLNLTDCNEKTGYAQNLTERNKLNLFKVMVLNQGSENCSEPSNNSKKVHYN